MDELYHCPTCERDGVDDTGGVWNMRDVVKYDDVGELWDKDGFMVDPPICPMHGDEMEDQYDRAERARDENEY